MRTAQKRSLWDRTCDGLDCIDLSYYISIDKSLEDVMQEIQMDFMYDHLPSDAMYIFGSPDFHEDVFRAMDEEAFETYLLERFPEEEWFDEDTQEFLSAG